MGLWDEKKGGIYLIIISKYKKEIKNLNERIKNIFASHGLIEMSSGQSDHS